MLLPEDSIENREQTREIFSEVIFHIPPTQRVFLRTKCDGIDVEVTAKEECSWRVKGISDDNELL